MCSVNAYLIQEKIRQKDYVTVPWIQAEYNLNYTEAKEFLVFLQIKGWVEKKPVGIEYPVVHGNLYLRQIKREEVSGLIEDLTSDCVTVLRCLLNKAMSGASYRDLIMAVRRDEDDTDDALEILRKHKLVHCINELYFITVSQATVSVFTKVEKAKYLKETLQGSSVSLEDEISPEELFDVLFDSQ